MEGDNSSHLQTFLGLVFMSLVFIFIHLASQLPGIRIRGSCQRQEFQELRTSPKTSLVSRIYFGNSLDVERNGNECKHKECRNEKEKRVNPRRISFLSSVKNCNLINVCFLTLIFYFIKCILLITISKREFTNNPNVINAGR